MPLRNNLIFKQFNDINSLKQWVNNQAGKAGGAMDNEKLKIEKIEAIPKCEHAEQTATEPEKEKVDPNKKVATPQIGRAHV